MNRTLGRAPATAAPLLSSRSGLHRERTEPLVHLEYAHAGEAGRRQQVSHSTFRLSRMPSESERNPAAWLHDAPYLSQPSHGIRPHLHGVDRQSAIESFVFKRQPLYRTLPQVDPTSFNPLRV